MIALQAAGRGEGEGRDVRDVAHAASACACRHVHTGNHPWQKSAALEAPAAHMQPNPPMQAPGVGLVAPHPISTPTPLRSRPHPPAQPHPQPRPRPPTQPPPTSAARWRRRLLVKMPSPAMAADTEGGAEEGRPLHAAPRPSWPPRSSAVVAHVALPSLDAASASSSRRLCARVACVCVCACACVQLRLRVHECMLVCVHLMYACACMESGMALSRQVLHMLLHGWMDTHTHTHTHAHTSKCARTPVPHLPVVQVQHAQAIVRSRPQVVRHDSQGRGVACSLLPFPSD